MASPSTPGDDRDARAADDAEAALAALGLGLGPRAGKRVDPDAGERAPAAASASSAPSASAPSSSGSSASSASARRRGRGRPPVSNPQTVEEAAAELFLELGYARTNVDDIARRAGVSRSTFFNYFEGKPDVLWGGIDAHVDDFEQALEAERLASAPASSSSDGGADAIAPVIAPWIVASVRRALLAAADRVPAASIPWAVAHADVMGTREELATTGMRRILRVESLVREHIAALEWAAGEESAAEVGTSARTDAGPSSGIARCSFAAAFTGAVRAGAAAWIAAGTSRSPLREYLDVALAPVCRGFAGPLADR